MERMNSRLDSILEGQKKLEETNSNLQLKNTRLKNELAKQERRVMIFQVTDYLHSLIIFQKQFRFIYQKMVEKKITQGFIVDEEYVHNLFLELVQFPTLKI